MKTYPDCNGDRVKICPDCNGDGVVDKDTDNERQCPTCGGLGSVRDDDDDHEEVIETSRELPNSVTTSRARLDDVPALATEVLAGKTRGRVVIDL